MAYHHLSINERDIIATQLRYGKSYRAIADILKRSHTTIINALKPPYRLMFSLLYGSGLRKAELTGWISR